MSTVMITVFAVNKCTSTTRENMSVIGRFNIALFTVILVQNSYELGAKINHCPGPRRLQAKEL